MPGNHSLEAYLNRLPKEKLLICRDSLLEKPSLSQYDQHVQLELVVGLLHGGHLVDAVLLDDLYGLEGGAAGAQERAALGEDAGEIAVCQQTELAVDEALIAVEEAVDLNLFF